MQRRIRILKHDLEMAAQRPHRRSGQLRDVLAAQQDLAGGRLEQAHDAAAKRRLAAAGLADQPQRLAGGKVERDVGDGAHMRDRAIEDHPAAHRKRLHQLAHRQDRLVLASLMGCAPPMRTMLRHLGQMAGAPGRPDEAQGRPLDAAAGLGQRAARMERAARRPVAQGRRPALDPDQRRVAGIERRQGGEQASGVGMARVVEHGIDVAALDDAAGVHDGDRIGHAGDHAEVVRDQDQPDAEAGAQALPAPPGSAPGP